jgi:hypothetical protein
LRNINVKQTILHRIIGIRDIEFSSSSSADVEIVFNGVSQIMAVMKRIQDA